MSVPMKSHLSPAWTISIASTRNITLRGDRREGRERGGRGGREEGAGGRDRRLCAGKEKREKRNLKKRREEERKGIKRVSQAVSEVLC